MKKNRRTKFVALAAIIAMNGLLNQASADDAAIQKEQPAGQVATTPPAENAQDDSRPQFTTKIEHKKPLDLSGKTVFVEFQDSPKLTTLVNKTLANRGLKVAEKKEDAQVFMVLAGAFASSGGQTKRISTSIGTLVEENKEFGDREYAGIVVDMGHALQTSTWRAFSVVSAADLLGQAFGLRAWFNKLVVGDPRGTCLGIKSCEEAWKIDQRVALILAEGEGNSSESYIETVQVDTRFKKFVPNELMGVAMDALLNDIAPVKPGSAAVSAAPAGAGKAQSVQ